MNRAVQNRRLWAMAALLVIAFCGLGYRLVDLQVTRHEPLLAEARRNSSRMELLTPRRGNIRDIKGNLLATSLPARTVFADPVLIQDYRSNVARAIAPHLSLSEWEIFQKLKPEIRYRTNENSVAIVTNRYVVLERKVSLERWLQISNAMATLRFGDYEKSLPRDRRLFFHNLRRHGISTDAAEDTLRVYPNRSLAAHVLGYAGTREVTYHDRPAIEAVGLDGVELAFNSKLNGSPGWRVTERDRRHREVAMKRLHEVEARDGLNVVLTLDTGLQHIVEAELAEVVERHRPLSATAIMVRPATGEILAMATVPTFDPNRPGDVVADARRNRAIMDQYEPGSTFKIVVVAGAYEDGLAQPAEMIYCENGSFRHAGNTLKDDHRMEWLTIQEVVSKSSNIGSAKLGLQLGPNRLHHHIRQFGFGQATGIPLHGEISGTVHPVRKWSGISITHIPMGHEVAVTPMQITMAMAAIANGGRLMRPMLVDRLEDDQGQVVGRYAPEVTRQAVSARTARMMTEALKATVSTNGTALKARLDYYTAAGKTGTAQVPGPRGYVPGKYVASFIGFFPADRPELVVSVIVNQPRNGFYGGQVAAPCFRQIALRSANYLNIRPDILELASPLETRLENGFRPVKFARQ